MKDRNRGLNDPEQRIKDYIRRVCVTLSGLEYTFPSIAQSKREGKV